MTIRTLVVAAAIAALATPAVAHAFLQHASPGAGTTFGVAPKQILLNFSEKLAPSFSGVSVTGADGSDEAAKAALIDGPSMKLELKPLPPGTYHVHWHAVSQDTHRTEGEYTFTVKP